MSSINAYVSRKNRGALPAPAEFVFQLLRVDRPILQGAEGFLDAGPVDLDDGFVAGLQLKFLDDLARDDDPEGRAPPPDPGPDTGHDYYMLDYTYNTSGRVFGSPYARPAAVENGASALPRRRAKGQYGPVPFVTTRGGRACSFRWRPLGTRKKGTGDSRSCSTAGRWRR